MTAEGMTEEAHLFIRRVYSYYEKRAETFGTFWAMQFCMVALAVAVTFFMEGYDLAGVYSLIIMVVYGTLIVRVSGNPVTIAEKAVEATTKRLKVMKDGFELSEDELFKIIEEHR